MTLTPPPPSETAGGSFKSPATLIPIPVVRAPPLCMCPGFSSLIMQNAFSTNTPLFQWDYNYRFTYEVSVN